MVGLPGAYFGTSTVPHLAVAVGKQGYVYLLNRDDLGGYDQGPGGGDNVVQRLGPFGGVWGRPGIWPGDGGYVYIPTSSGRTNGGELDVYKYGLTGTGDPSLSQVAKSTDVFGFGSGSPVITSDGTNSGSALVWIIWAANRQGAGGQLRAYDPVPVNGHPVLLWSASIGTATNYSTPGVGAGRLYVGTRDGHVLAFGSPVTQPLSGSGLTFSRTTIGTSSASQTLTMTANKALTISSLSFGAASSQFSWGNPSQTLPVTLATGQKFSVEGHLHADRHRSGRRSADAAHRRRRRVVLAPGHGTARSREARGEPGHPVAGRHVGGRELNGTVTTATWAARRSPSRTSNRRAHRSRSPGAPAPGSALDPGTASRSASRSTRPPTASSPTR